MSWEETVFGKITTCFIERDELWACAFADACDDDLQSKSVSCSWAMVLVISYSSCIHRRKQTNLVIEEGFQCENCWCFIFDGILPHYHMKE
jgi:hypothetical protein